jgi:site-specific recombinase XerD
MIHLHHCDHRKAVSAVVVDGQQIVPAFGTSDTAHQLIKTYLPEEGTPFALDDDGCLDRKLGAFFMELRNGVGGVSLKTVKDYAKDLAVFARFLAVQRKKSVWAADSSDVAEYRRYRLEGPTDARMQKTSWVRALAALQRFYGWAADPATRKVAINPISKTRRDRLIRQNRVRMISMQDFVVLRNVGALGQGTDGLRDPGFQGRFPLRNAAFFELLITSGHRCQEGNSLLMGALPDPDDRMFDGRHLPKVDGEISIKLKHAMIVIPATITKGEVTRRVPYSRRTALHFISPYLREERPALVERWRESGGVADLGERMILACSDGQGYLRVVENSRHRNVGKRRKLSSMTIEDRRKLVIIPNADAPLAQAERGMLWLGEGGRPMLPSTWNQVFRRASERCEKMCGIVIDATPHKLRHSFAVYMLSAMIKQQAVELEELARRKQAADHKDTVAVEAYSRVVGDPLRILQGFMGHASQITTQRYLNDVIDVHRHVEEAVGRFQELMDISTLSKD